ncbi:MAG: hypothetical protein AABP62_11160 [Planctomycetota bacterium]
MPLTDIGSYVPMMQEISLHWADVDAELGGTPATALKLEGNFGRIEFGAATTELDALNISIEDLENVWEIAVGERDNTKGTLRQKLSQFRAMLRAVLPKSKYALAAPTLPNFGADESKFLGPFDDAASLWLRINADTTIPGFTPPLVIGGLTQALFATAVAGMRTAYGQVRQADNDLNLGRKERQGLLNPAKERMIQYGSAVEGLFGPDHPLTQSLPRLFEAPGSTPEPMQLTGVWNPVTGMAEFSWTGPSNPNLDHFQMRVSIGSTYDAATATVVGNIPAGSTTFGTTERLENPGDEASFKLFVILTTGNEAGSNTVTITRP